MVFKEHQQLLADEYILPLVRRVKLIRLRSGEVEENYEISLSEPAPKRRKFHHRPLDTTGDVCITLTSGTMEDSEAIFLT